MQTNPQPNLISFVIPAHNEETELPQTLHHLYRAARQLGLHFEVLVVADSCTDRTSAIACEFGASVVEVNHRQISRTRNAGAERARGSYLFFVDADTRIGTEVLAAALQALESGALGGGALVLFEGSHPFWIRWSVGALISVLRKMRVAAGCFFFCRKSDFVALGGFPVDAFAAEEVLLSFSFKRRGRFVALRESVTTSGRKLRTHSAYELLAATLRPLWKGSRAFSKRDGLELWYGERRKDPAPPQDPDAQRAPLKSETDSEG